MLPLPPLSLLCAILLCLPLAAIFTFTTPTATVSSSSAAPSPPISVPVSPPPQKPIPIKNRTADYSDDDDDEDVSLLKAASRTDPNPKSGKKLAFMFLTASPLAFAPLWEMYFARAPKTLYNVYVHADPRVDYTDSFRGAFAGRVVPSKHTRRHTPTLISAARRLLAHALLHDEANAAFALLSPSCVPIRPFRVAYRVLTRSRRSFVEILRDEPGAYDRWAARGEDAMLPEVGFEEFRIGSQFWAVRRRHARAIVRDTRLWSKFRLPCLDDATCYPEEQYFPTLLSMVDPRGCTPCTLTHVEWRGGHGGHPRMYNGSEVGPDLIRALRRSRPRYGDEELKSKLKLKLKSESNGTSNSNSMMTSNSNSTMTTIVVKRRRQRHDPFLFARKFSPGSLHQLISMANDVILKD